MIVCDIILFCEYYQSLLIDQDDHHYVCVQELCPIFSTTFRCCSPIVCTVKPAQLLDTFELGRGDGMPCRGKIVHYSGETFLLLWLIIASWSYRNQSLKFSEKQEYY